MKNGVHPLPMPQPRELLASSMGCTPFFIACYRLYHETYLIDGTSPPILTMDCLIPRHGIVEDFLEKSIELRNPNPKP